MAVAKEKELCNKYQLGLHHLNGIQQPTSQEIIKPKKRSTKATERHKPNS